MFSFVKKVFISTIGTFIGITLFFTLGVSSLVVLLIASSVGEGATKVKEKSILVFDLSTQIRDTQPASSLGEALSGEERNTLPLRQLLKAIDKATQDERIIGIFLDGRKSGLGTGYANLKEVRNSLEKFRAAGKKIIAYDVNLTEREYYLASVADTIIINPMGVMEMNGLGAQQLFLTGALEKYGLGVQVVRVGSYKAAVEPLIRKDYSPESREQTQALLNDVWGELLQSVATSRDIPAEKIQNTADTKGLLMAQEALTDRFVDRVAYFDEVLTQLKQLTETKEDEDLSRQISLQEYVDVSVKNLKERSSKNKIALVYAEGAIVAGTGNVDQIGGYRFAKELRQIREDKQVKAVVVRINSPGGSATASEIILRELELIRQAKPVIVSMGNVAASGGYWLATGSDYIFAQENTVTGSIGVFGLLLNLQEIANNNGLTWDTVKTGRLADLGTSTRPQTQAELEIFQKTVSEIYDMFLDKVAKSRNLPKEKVAQIAQGRVWSGADAREIGLVDDLGGLEAAIEYAAKQADLGDDWKVAEYPEKRSWEQEILEKIFKTQVQTTLPKLDPIAAQMLQLKEDLAIVSKLNDPHDIYALMPIKFTID